MVTKDIVPRSAKQLISPTTSAPYLQKTMCFSVGLASTYLHHKKREMGVGSWKKYRMAASDASMQLAFLAINQKCERMVRLRGRK